MTSAQAERDALPTVEEALAYANGYAAALDDCDRADVADLITKLDAEKVRHSFTKALLQIAERKIANQAACIAAFHAERGDHHKGTPEKGADNGA